MVGLDGTTEVKVSKLRLFQTEVSEVYMHSTKQVLYVRSMSEQCLLIRVICKYAPYWYFVLVYYRLDVKRRAIEND